MVIGGTTPTLKTSGPRIYITGSEANINLVTISSITGCDMQIQTLDTNRNVRLNPNGSGKVHIGGDSPTITAITNKDLVLQTMDNNRDINFTPHGTGAVVVNSHLYMATAKDIRLVTGQYIKTAGNSTLVQFNDSGIIVNGSITSPSDVRLKANLSRCGGVSVVRRMNGWQWDWRSNGRTTSGVIAQELRDVLPYAVHENSAGLFARRRHRGDQGFGRRSRCAARGARTAAASQRRGTCCLCSWRFIATRGKAFQQCWQSGEMQFE